MTNEEAIEVLYDIQTDVVYNITSKEKEALEKAIEALEKQIPKNSNMKHVCIVCKCSRCGKLFTTYRPRTNEAKFCDDCDQQLD